MWREFVVRFLVLLFTFGIMFRLFGRKPFGFVLVGAIAFALLFSIPRLVFGYYPDLDRGWMSYAVGAAVALPPGYLMASVTKRRQKHDHDA